MDEMSLSKALSILKKLGQLLPTNVEDSNFVAQHAFINDPAKLKAALCSRRAGKSYGVGLYLIKTALEYPGVKCLYIALTRDSAKNIMWDDVIKDIINKHDLDVKLNEVDLAIRFKNGSTIRMVGADAKPAEMEKFLGQKYKLVIIDESGSFKQDLRKLVYEIAEPATTDMDGTIALIGTPTDLIKSLFYDITNGKEPGWSVHKWTSFQNPYIAEKWDKKTKEMIERDPDVINTPAYKRMYEGQWFINTDKLVYKYNKTLNTYTELPRIREQYYHVIGVDLGYDDDSSFIASCYSEYDPILYVVSAFKQKKMTIFAVATKIKELMERYNTGIVVIDGANKQAVEEMKQRYALPLKTADKTGKSDFIEMMNSDFMLGKIKLHDTDTVLLSDEYIGLIWDDRTGKRQEHPSCPNHASDAALYNWRYCYQYAWQNRPVKHALTSERAVDDFWEAESQKSGEKDDSLFDFWRD
jgi:hypothetical protein